MSERPLKPAGSWRILVAEDEPHIGRLLLLLLEAAGFQVSLATNGEGALELLRAEGTLDLALLDLMLPGMDGLGVLTQLRQLPHRQTLPVIVLTAKGEEADREEALALGADAFVTKPFSPKKLLHQIDALLRPH